MCLKPAQKLQNNSIDASLTSERINLQSLDSIRALIMTSSGSKSFCTYSFLNFKEKSVVKRTLMGRVKEFCGYYHINLYKYIFNNKYRQNIEYCTYKSVHDMKMA